MWPRLCVLLCLTAACSEHADEERRPVQSPDGTLIVAAEDEVEEEPSPDMAVALELSALPKLQLPVRVYAAPPVESSGGTLFLVGFDSLDPERGKPAEGAAPAVIEVLLEQVSVFPAEAVATLQVGMPYMVLYGQGDQPSPGDRQSPLVRAAEGTPLMLTLGQERMPEDAR